MSPIIEQIGDHKHGLVNKKALKLHPAWHIEPLGKGKSMFSDVYMEYAEYHRKHNLSDEQVKDMIWVPLITFLDWKKIEKYAKLEEKGTVL